MNDQDLIVILGPTASGKTNLACQVAYELGREIISADSRQIYKGMDVGTGKDLDEYEVNGIEIPYHLIDIHEPGYKYNIAEYQLDFYKVLENLKSRSKRGILCGGSGLYIESALKGNSFLGIPMQEERKKELQLLSDQELSDLHSKVSELVKNQLSANTRGRIIRAVIVDEYLKEHPDFKPREIPEFNYTIYGVDIDRELRRHRIEKRLKFRLENGLIEEAERLYENGLSYEDMEYYGLEYKWLALYLKGELGKNELFQGLRNSIFKFAKRQMTWFRRMEKNGYQIHWLDTSKSLDDKVQQIISSHPL